MILCSVLVLIWYHEHKYRPTRYFLKRIHKHTATYTLLRRWLPGLAMPSWWFWRPSFVQYAFMTLGGSFLRLEEPPLDREEHEYGAVREFASLVKLTFPPCKSLCPPKNYDFE